MKVAAFYGIFRLERSWNAGSGRREPSGSFGRIANEAHLGENLQSFLWNSPRLLLQKSDHNCDNPDEAEYGTQVLGYLINYYPGFEFRRVDENNQNRLL